VMAILRRISLKMTVKYAYPPEKTKREAGKLVSRGYDTVITFAETGRREANSAFA
jgi:hypothetical protein